MELIRVVIRIDRTLTEQLWASRLEGSHCKIENVPILAYDMSLHDIVEVDRRLRVLGVHRKSGNRTVRMSLRDLHIAREKLVDEITVLGCRGEIAVDRVLAINVLPNVPLEAVTSVVARAGPDWETSDPSSR